MWTMEGTLRWTEELNLKRPFDWEKTENERY